MRSRAGLETGSAVLAAALAVGAVLLVATRGSLEGRRQADAVWAATQGGDTGHGATLIAAKGCGTCHEIPGITGAHGRVGPSLVRFGARTYVAGVLPNTPGDLVRWLQNPRAVDPRTAMPELGLDEPAARDVAAYLYVRTQ